MEMYAIKGQYSCGVLAITIVWFHTCMPAAMAIYGTASGYSEIIES